MKSFFILAALFISGCSHAHLNEKDCSVNLSKAVSHLNDYYLDKDPENLQLSLSLVDSFFTRCPSGKRQWSHLKITLLMLSKEYGKGAEFVNTLGEGEFDKPYQKEMYLNPNCPLASSKN